MSKNVTDFHFGLPWGKTSLKFKRKFVHVQLPATRNPVLIQLISYTACVSERERLVESRTHEAIWELYKKYKSTVY